MSSVRAAYTSDNKRSSFLLRHKHQFGYLALGICLIALLVLRHGFVHTNSFTFDELTHIQAGYRYWQCGEFANNPEHPPLAKLIAAAPIRHWQLEGYPTPCGAQVIRSREMDLPIALALYHSPHARELLWHARASLIVFPLVLLLAVFFAARAWLGHLAATIAALLITFEPTLLGHGSLVTTDMALTATTFLAVFVSIECARRRSWIYFVLCGIALGLAVASKHSAFAVPFICLATMLASALMQRLGAKDYLRLVCGWLVACMLAFVILWAFYGFRYGALPHEAKPAYDLMQPFAHEGLQNTHTAHTVSFLGRHRLLPEAYLAGLADIATFSSRPTYFFGRYYAQGFWYYFPVTLVIKLTIGLLLLFAYALFNPRVWRTHGQALIPCSIPLIVFLGFAMYGKLDIGVRHVLPVLPFMVIFAAAAASDLLQYSRATGIAAVLLIGLSIFSAARSAPQQLSYANELFGGPDRLHRYLGDSNIDWGQSSDRLQSFLESSNLHSDCAVATGTLFRDPSACTELPFFLADLTSPQLPPVIGDAFEGTVIVQPLAAAWSSAYIPFLNRTPDEIHGAGTILVYRGKFDFSEIAAQRRFDRGLKMLAFAHDLAGAKTEFAAAEPHCPESLRDWLHQMEQVTASAGQHH
jgi:4-amino-4-deoxy-L-arabinose transferase-like glycosyltransferase